MHDAMRVALYARVSSERQADEATIQSQLAALRQRSAADGVHVEPELCFVDDGYSGATLVRPALERLRDLTHCGGLDRLYVYAPDRLARKYAYQVILLEEFGKCDVQVVFLNDIAAPPSPETDLLVQVQGMIAEYERAKILERTRRGRRYAARQGKVSVLGHAPYGYRYVPKHEGGGVARYDVVLEQARLVQEMFTWVGVAGCSLGDVVRRLAERGVPTATGQPRWDRATIRGILINTAYQGTAKYGKTRLVPRKNEPRRKRGAPAVPRCATIAQPTTAAEQEDIAVPALISAELFAAAASRLQENRRHQREQKQGAEFLLSGLLVCHRCGSAYCGRRLRHAARTAYVYYRCIATDKYRYGGEARCTNKSVNGVLDDTVWADLCALLQDPDRLRREFERRLQQPAQANLDAGHLEKSIAQLKRRIARLLDAYENGWVDKAEFEPRIRTVKERLDREEEALGQHQRDALNEEELRLVVSQFEAFAQQMTAGLAEADFATRRKLLRLLIKRIEVDESEVRIIYRVQLRPFDGSPASRGVLQHCLKFHRKAQGKRSAALGYGGIRKYFHPERVGSTGRVTLMEPLRGREEFSHGVDPGRRCACPGLWDRTPSG